MLSGGSQRHILPNNIKYLISQGIKPITNTRLCPCATTALITDHIFNKFLNVSVLDIYLHQ